MLFAKALLGLTYRGVTFPFWRIAKLYLSTSDHLTITSTMQIEFNQIKSNQVNMYCIQWYMPLMPQAGHNVVRSESSLLYLLFFVGWHCQLPLTTFCAVLVCDEPTKHTIACKAWLQLANIIFAWHVFKEPEQNTLRLSYVNKKRQWYCARRWL